MQPPQESDIVLWQKLKQGSTDALGLIYDRYVDDLFMYGTQFSQDKQIIMDGIHDLFLSVYKYHKNLSDTDNVQYYLYRSLKNQLTKAPKSKIFYFPNSQFPESFITQQSVSSHEEELAESDYFDERTLQLSNALEILSKKQKQGIFLRFHEDRKYEEIAAIMNVSVQTSRTIIYRAVKVLRASLTIYLILTLFFL